MSIYSICVSCHGRCLWTQPKMPHFDVTPPVACALCTHSNSTGKLLPTFHLSNPNFKTKYLAVATPLLRFFLGRPKSRREHLIVRGSFSATASVSGTPFRICYEGAHLSKLVPKSPRWDFKPLSPLYETLKPHNLHHSIAPEKCWKQEVTRLGYL